MIPIEEVIARLCHQVNRAYCLSIGDNSQPVWEDSPEWQRKSAIEGVKFLRDNLDATPEDSHKSWLAVKEKDGWVYGDVKDPEAKTHPCIVPYNQLSVEQKSKDYIYHAIVRNY